MQTAQFADLQPQLFWHDTSLHVMETVASGVLQRGDKTQLILNDMQQHQLLETWLKPQQQLLYIMQNKKKIKSLGHALGMVLSGRGLLANLSIQENIMLPFLYHNQPQHTEQAHMQLENVAATLGLASILGEKAGLRSPLIHALVSLCRCVLQQASFMVMQQPCAQMSLHEAEQFRPLARRVVDSLGAGLLYITDNVEDDAQFVFGQQLGFVSGKHDEGNR